jgi:voltage-gated potassium channel
MTLSVRRLFQALLLLAIVILAGAGGYYLLGKGHWRFGDTLYMSIITVATVGFAELPGLEGVHGARALTSVLIISGMGTVAYFTGDSATPSTCRSSP